MSLSYVATRSWSHVCDLDQCAVRFEGIALSNRYYCSKPIGLSGSVNKRRSASSVKMGSI